MTARTRIIARRMAALVAVALLFATHAQANVSLFMEEPFGTFGAFNPTGHAAIYMDNVCADSPTELRLCRRGEMGVVISRYHHVAGYDWLAMPLIPYLYAVDDLYDQPSTITPASAQQLRNAYRRQHLRGIAPDAQDGGIPAGEWTQLVGASFDRSIHVFQVTTTREQDAMLVAKLNDRRNHSHFNLFFNNCADFSRGILRTLYPDILPHNALADFGLTTPKHLARSLLKAGSQHPEMHVRVFDIPQLPGTTIRSHHVDGIAESLVRSKKYFVPLAFLSPTTAASLLAAYIGTGRFTVPKNAPLLPELVVAPLPFASIDSIVLTNSITLGESGPVPALSCISDVELHLADTSHALTASVESPALAGAGSN